MNHIDRHFFVAAILFAVVGVGLGIAMGMTEDFQYIPVHAHINLVGWVSFAIFGTGYRVGFARRDRMALLHYLVALSGAIIFPAGLYLAITQQRVALVIIGSVLTLASILLFLVNVVRAWSAEA
jgi:hypothetical protein